MPNTPSYWEQIYQQVPLIGVPQHYAGMRQSPFTMQYLQAILERCPRGGRTLETGVGSGYGAVWLSLRGVIAEGIDIAPANVERAAQVNTVIGGRASFRYGDLFALYSADAPRYDVIYHQGVLEHFTLPQIRAALAQQVALAECVVFSVPSVYYPFPGEFGDERLLTLEVWQEILAPFKIEILKYYGDPQHGEHEHVLCILRGQKITPELLEMMTAHMQPFPTGITGLVLARDEELNIQGCLETLQFCDQIIVIDMESKDRTLELATPLATCVISHPIVSPFDRARNPGIMLALHSHILVIDADERVPTGLAERLRAIVTNDPDGFDGMRLPFKHFFCGHWMANPGLYPGYTSPRLLKNGKCIFNSKLHSGVQVDGRITHFPADNPELAIHHYSFRSLAHYQTKQNEYTTTEARTMLRDGATFDWRSMIQHYFADLMSYYDAGRAAVDGPYGLIYAMNSANYRMLQHAKLFEMRANAGLLQPQELTVPQSSADIVGVMAQMLNQTPKPQPEAIVIADSPEAADIVMTGAAFDRSGYAEEFRNALFGAAEAGLNIRVQSLPWNDDPNILTELERAVYDAMRARPAKPGFTHIIWDFPQGWYKHPNAGFTIVRTMHETDRFPEPWVQASHLMDEIWVPTEFNKQTAIDSGIEAHKIRVVPGGFNFESSELSRGLAQESRNEEIQENPSEQKSRKKENQKYSLRQDTSVKSRAVCTTFGPVGYVPLS